MLVRGTHDDTSTLQFLVIRVISWSSFRWSENFRLKTHQRSLLCHLNNVHLHPHFCSPRHCLLWCLLDSPTHLDTSTQQGGHFSPCWNVLEWFFALYCKWPVIFFFFHFNKNTYWTIESPQKLYTVQKKSGFYAKGLFSSSPHYKTFDLKSA